jgi:hypothetical protein
VRQLGDRERHQVQREERPRAHRPDVGEGVRGGDAAEPVRVVDDRREEVDGLDDRLLVGEREDGRVVARLVADEDARIVGAWEVAQDLREIRRADLARSTGAVAEAREAHRIVGHASGLTRAPASGQGQGCGVAPASLR